MSAWPRLLACCAFVAALGLSARADAQSNADRAAALAEEAKALVVKNQFAQASEKLRQAVVLAPEGRYYVKLCTTLYFEGKFGEALTACNAVEPNGADAKTKEKKDQVVGEIKKAMREQGMDPDQVDTNLPPQNQTPPPDGTNPPGPNQTPPGNQPGTVPPPQQQFVGRPPQMLYVQKPPSHDYAWTIGGQLFGGGTTVGGSEYEDVAGGFRLDVDYLLMRRQRIGLQAYLGFTSVASAFSDANSLSIVDLGIGGFKNFCASRFCLTPLLGVHISSFQPDTNDPNVQMVAVGLRAEATGSLSFGSHWEHVLTASLGVNGYTAAAGEYQGASPSEYGLDEPGRAVYLGVGYTHRFDTPFGSSPFITLD